MISQEVIIALIGAVVTILTLVIRTQSGHIDRMQNQIEILIETCIDPSDRDPHDLDNSLKD